MNCLVVKIPIDLLDNEEDSEEERTRKRYERWELRGFQEDPPLDDTAAHLREVKKEMGKGIKTRYPSHFFPHDTYEGEAEFFIKK